MSYCTIDGARTVLYKVTNYTKAFKSVVRVGASVVRILGLVLGLVQSLDRNFTFEAHHKFVTFRNHMTLWSNSISSYGHGRRWSSRVLIHLECFEAEFS